MSGEISGRVLPTHEESLILGVFILLLYIQVTVVINVMYLCSRGSRIRGTRAVIARGHFCRNFFSAKYDSPHWLVFCKSGTEARGRL